MSVKSTRNARTGFSKYFLVDFAIRLEPAQREKDAE